MVVPVGGSIEGVCLWDLTELLLQPHWCLVVAVGSSLRSRSRGEMALVLVCA